MTRVDRAIVAGLMTWVLLVVAILTVKTQGLRTPLLEGGGHVLPVVKATAAKPVGFVGEQQISALFDTARRTGTLDGKQEEHRRANFEGASR